MKKLSIAVMALVFALTVKGQKTTTVGSDDQSRTLVTTTVVGKNTVLTSTGKDQNGNTWILTQNIRKRLKNWNFVVISKSGEVTFSDNGKRKDFERTSEYTSGNYTKRGLGFQLFSSPDAGRVQGSRIDMTGGNRSY
jgi:hypothetical protein